MKRLIFFLLVSISLSLSAELSELKDFFSRKGYVVEKLEDRVIIDLGKGKVREGEVFKVIKEGKEIVHPVTKEVLGKVNEEVGKIEVSEVKDRFSFARILEDKGIEKGNRVELYYRRVCFVGSDEGFFKVSSLVGSLKRGEDCDYVIREFDDGYGVEYRGTAVAFFKKPKPKVVVQAKKVEKRPEEFKLHAKFVMTFPGLPLSADICRFFGDERSYLTVLYEGKLVIYEVLNGEVSEYTSMSLPSGYPVSVQCVPLDEGNDLIIVNEVSGSSASSMLVKMVGGSPVVVKKNIPYILSVLDKKRSKETLIGQKFESGDLWGEVKRFEFNGEELVEKGDFKVPSGFRIDSAVMVGDLLAFTDKDGYLRVYKGDELLLSEEGFSGSYTTAELPDIYEDEDKYTFNVRHFVARVDGKDYLGVIRNVRSPVYRFLDVTKFTEGEIYLVLVDERGVAKLEKLQGKRFEEAIQSVLMAGDNRLFVITGRTGTLPLQNRGDLFEVEIEPIR